MLVLRRGFSVRDRTDTAFIYLNLMGAPPQKEDFLSRMKNVVKRDVVAVIVIK